MEKTIEEKFKEAIRDSTTCENESYYYEELDRAAESCMAIHKSECVKFAEWIIKEGWVCTPVYIQFFKTSDPKNIITPEELFDIYTEQTKIKG